MNKNVTLICDLQFGSTGKGLIAGYIAKKEKPDTIITAWGANAGHTFIDSDDRRYVHIMVANGIISPNLKRLLIGPGSMIDADILMSEIGKNFDHLKDIDLVIHPNASVILPCHKEREQGPMTKIGSTKKGCGEAIIDKIRRDPKNMTIAKEALKGTALEKFVCDDTPDYHAHIMKSKNILIEGSQGYSLGISSGFYPYTTSRECTPAQIMSDCGVPLGNLKKVIGTMRTFPIRVANRFNDKGEQVGYSGPCYSDQREISWSDIGIEPELTTVTRLPRRVFTFSTNQTLQAKYHCEPNEVFLNFCNYLPKVGSEDFYTVDQLTEIIDECGYGKVKYWGYGPSINDVHEEIQ